MEKLTFNNEQLEFLKFIVQDFEYNDDHEKYFSFYNDERNDFESWPFNQRFHLLLNIAVGGNWPGSPDETTAFPAEMEIEYVRVYEKLPS